MKKLSLLLILFCLNLSAEERFTPEPLHAQDNFVFVISSFDKVDYFTTIDRAGTFLWEIPFSSKVLSYKVSDGLVVIFSKHRTAQMYFLSCFNEMTGESKWEKNILPPKEEN